MCLLSPTPVAVGDAREAQVGAKAETEAEVVGEPEDMTEGENFFWLPVCS